MNIQFRNRDLLSAQYAIYEIEQHALKPVVMAEAPRFSNSVLQPRIDQIKSLIKNISDSQLQRVAIAFETVKNQTIGDSKKSFFFKKKADSQISFFIHEGQLLLKTTYQDNPAWTRSGAYKQVSCIPGFPYMVQEEGYPMAKKVSKKPASDALSDINDCVLVHQQCLTELATIEPLNLISKPVLWFSYTSSKAQCERVLSLEPFCPHTFRDKEARELSQKHLAMLFSQIIEQLLALHQQGYFHGDIKRENVIWRRGNSNVPIAIWTDFGNAAQTDQKTVSTNYWHQRGFYGTPPYTPPEVLGKRPFNGNVEAVEIWALGCMCIEIATNATVSWAVALKKLFDDAQKNSFPIYDEKPVLTKIEEALNVYAQQLPSVELKFAPFAQLGLEILQVDPTKRPSLQNILQRFKQIQENAPPPSPFAQQQ